MGFSEGLEKYCYYSFISTAIALASLLRVNAQVCDNAGKGNSLPRDQSLLCAPSTVNWNVYYFGLDDSQTNEVLIDWGDGSPVVTATLTCSNPADPVYLQKFETTVSHTYPKGDGRCIYPAEADLRVNGTLCDESGQAQDIIVWDTDDVLGSGLLTNVEEYEVCAGNEVTVHFTDITQFSCLAPDHPNNVGRWIQWEYGTANTITGSVSIDGSPRTLPYSVAPVKLPKTATNSGELSLNVSIPETSQNGEFFELTLNNWNSCNPYEDEFGNLTGNAPVTKMVYIRIVDAPDADFNFDSDPSCVNNPVQITNNSIPGLQYSWDFGDGTSSNLENPSKTYTSPGTYDVTLTVTNNTIVGNTGTCETSITKSIEIIPQPVADFNIVPSTAQCKNTSVDLNNTSAHVPAGTTWKWIIRKGSSSGQRVELNGNDISGEAATSEDIVTNLPYFGSSPVATYYVRLQANTPNACTDASPWKTIEVISDVGVPAFVSPTTTRCQGTGTTQYTANAVNADNYSWSMSPVSAGTIDSNGEVTWDAAFSGNATIEVTAKGCGADQSASINVDVTEKVGDPNSIGGNKVICRGTASGTYTTSATSASSYNWSISGAGNSISGTGTLATVTWDPSFEGTATITVEAQGCSGTSAPFSTDVEVKPIPEFTNSTSDYSLSICSGSTAEFMPSTTLPGTRFRWTTTITGSVVGVSSSATDQMVGTDKISDLITNTGNTVETVTYHITPYNNGCDGPTQDFVVTVHPDAPESAGTIIGFSEICAGTTNVNLSVPSIGRATSYIWTVPAGATFISASDTKDIVLDLSATVPGDHVISVYGSNKCGNGSEATFNLKVKPIPILTATTTDTDLCYGDEAVVSLGSSISGTLYSWQVVSKDADINGESNISNADVGELRQQLFNVRNTPQQITYRIFPSYDGCDGPSEDITFTVQPQPQTTLSPSALSVCNGDQADVAISSSVASSTFTWIASVSDPALTGASDGSGDRIQQNLNNTSNQPQTVTYDVTASANGCDGPAESIAITVQPTPVVSSTVISNNICSGESVDISLSSNVVGTTFSWTVTNSSGGLTGGSAGSGSSIQHVLTNSTNLPQTITYTITPNVNGCDGASEDITITVNPEPSLTANAANTQICNNETTDISLSSDVASTSFSWSVSVSDPSVVNGASAGTGSSIQQTLENSSNTVQTVTYQVTTNAYGCSGQSQDIVISIYPTPVVTLDPAKSTVCSGENAQINFTGNVTGSSYSWTVVNSDPSNVSGAFSNAGSSINQTLTNTGTAPGQITYQVTPTVNGCVGPTEDIVITVNPATRNADAGGDDEICGLSYTMAAVTPTVGTGNWIKESGPGNVVFDDPADPATLVTVDDFGVYTFRWTLTNGSCGSDFDFVNVRFKKAPITSAISGNTDVCVNTQNVLYDVSFNPGSTYNWTISPAADAPTVRIGGGLSDNFIALDYGPNPWSGELVVVETKEGCAGLPQKLVLNSFALPVAHAGSDQTICEGSSATLGDSPSATGGSGAYSYIWTPAIGLEDATLPNPAASPTFTRTYSLTVTDVSTGCVSAQDDITINVQPQLQAGTITGTQLICEDDVPSPFTQNPANGGDGNYVYQWQKSVDGGSTYNDIPGAVSAEYQETTPITTSTLYRRKVNSGVCGEVITTPIEVQVEPLLVAGTISSDQTIVAGSVPANLTSLVDASGGSNLAYQWQKATGTGTNYTNIPGASSPEYQPGPLALTTFFRRVASGGKCDPVESNIITITVESASEAGTIASDQVICVNSIPAPISEDEAASGGTGSYNYRWLSSNDGVNFTIISGANGTEYAPTNPIGTTTYYKREVQSGVSPWVSSNVITVDVEPLPDGGIISGDQTVCANDNPDIFLETTPVSGGSGSYTYQWKSSTSAGGPYIDIPLATNKLYDVPTGLSVTTFFVREVSSGVCAPALSNEITVTVEPSLFAGEVAGDQTICEGSSVAPFTETAPASGGSGTYGYQWKSSPNVTGPFTDITGADQVTYQVLGSPTQTTYYVREVSSGTCSNQLSNPIRVIVEPALTAGQISGNDNICEGDATSALVSVSFPTGGNGNYNFQWKSSTTAGGPYTNIIGADKAGYDPPDGLSSTTYYVREVSSGQCAAVLSNEISIEVEPALNAGSVGSDQSIVLGGDPTIFTEIAAPSGGDGTYTYQWQYSVGTSDSFTDIGGATSNVYDAPSGMIQTTYYRRAVTSSVCGIAYSDTIKIEVESNLEPGKIGNDQVICEGSIPADLVEISAPSGGDSSYAYQWKSSTDRYGVFDTITGANDANLVLTSPLFDTTYYVRFVSSGAYPPLQTDTVAIAVQPTLSAGTIGTSGNEEICLGDQPGLLQETTPSEGGDGSYEYQWFSKTIGASNYQPIAGANTPDYQPPSTLETSTYYKRRVLSGSCGEEFSNEMLITVNPLPIISLRSSATDNTICRGTKVVFTAAGATEYEFFLNGNSVQGPSPLATYSTDSLSNLDTVFIRGTNANGCELESASIETVVNDLPEATISGSTDICIGEQATLIFSMTGKIPFEVVYSDGKKEHTLSNQGSESIINVRPEALTTYRLISVKDANGCLRDIVGQEAVVNVGNPIARFALENKDTGCSPYTVQFRNEDLQEGVTYKWLWGDGTEDLLTTAADSSIVEHTFTNFNTTRDMTYQVSLIAMHDSIGCEDRAVASIQVPPSPIVRIEQDTDEGCGPLLVNFTNNTLGASQHRWYYRIKGTNQILEESIDKSQAYLLPNETKEPILYEIVYEGSNEKCTSLEIFEVLVFPELLPKFTVSPKQQYLPNSTVNVVNETPEGDWQYLWDFGDGTTSTERNPRQHTYEGYGQFYITLTISYKGCEKEYEEFIILDIDPDLPFIEFKADSHVGCGPLEVTFTNQSNYVDPATFQWDFGDGSTASGIEHPNHVYENPGKYSIKLEATNIFGEQKLLLKDFLVEVYKKPRAAFSAGPPTVYLPDKPIGTINQTIGATHYEWDFGDGTTSNEFEPTHTYVEEGTYSIQLVATNDQGCSDTLLIDRMVTVLEPKATKPRVPNSFTPNPDGPNGGYYQSGDVSNDIFIPVIDGVTEMSMTIYNRWGNVMFTSNEKNKGWDGYFEGKLCPADVYYYKIEMKFTNGERKTEYGDVTLIR